jgi:GPH family glycoside/pentoside/hexuronide:cation symporter
VFVLSFFLNGFGNAIAGTLFLLYCSARLELEELRGPLLLLYFISGVVSVPFWLRVTKRFSKHRTWCVAMMFAAIVFSPAPFLGQESILLFGAICILTGFTLGADIALPPSIQADVIDVDTARSGEQRSGTYFALWSLVTKMSLAVAVVVVFSILEQAGFSAVSDTASTAFSITLLGFIYGWGPIIMKVPAVVLMWNFPLGQQEVLRLRIEIERSADSNHGDPPDKTKYL